MKPRISRYAADVTTICDAERRVVRGWRCYGFGVAGHGDTPHEAYVDWAVELADAVLPSMPPVLGGDARRRAWGR